MSENKEEVQGQFASDLVGNLDDIKFDGIADEDPVELQEQTSEEVETAEKPVDTDASEEAPTETVDTETDTGSEGEEKPDGADTDTDTDTPGIQRLQELGLYGQYKTEDAALGAIPHLRSELENQRNLNRMLQSVVAERRESQPLQPKPQQQLTDKEREEIAWFESVAQKAGYKKIDDSEAHALESRIDSAEYKQNVSSYANTLQTLGFNDVAATVLETGSDSVAAGANPQWDAMMQLANRHPEIKRNMSASSAIRLLYEATKDKFKAPTKPKVAPVSPDKKKSAKTTGSERGGSEKPLTVPHDFDKWGIDRQLRYLEDHNLIYG